MPDHGPTLPDLLATVPHLLETCAPRWDECSTKKALRLVSKELSVTTMKVLVCARVQLGEGACPTPRQLVRMLQPSRLMFLNVTILTTSGRASPLLAQQLATCTSQMEELVQGMGPAVQSATFLTIRFEHRQLKSGRSSAKPPSTATTATTTASATSTSDPPEPPHETACPASFAELTRSICTMLAAALPSLRYLTIQGSCRNPAFAAFGASCPRLTSLTVDALTFPIKALKGITTQLPQLKDFSLTARGPNCDGAKLAEYVGASLLALQPSVLLSAMHLSFERNLRLECKPGDWMNVPPNLHTLYVGCHMHGIRHATALLGTLRTICVQQTLRLHQVLEIVRLAPHLKELAVIATPACIVWCDREEIMEDISFLREGLLAGGLDLTFSSLQLVDASADLAAVLAALPSLARVARTCVIQFSGAPQPNCLAQFARVFPDLMKLSFVSGAPLLQTSVLSKELLQALAACKSLRMLSIHMQISLTTADLVQLCLSLPALKELQFVESDDISLPDVLSALAANGRDLEVEELSL